MDILFSLKTNEAIVEFVLNNMILLLLIRHILTYICKKTPWAVDDDLPIFFGGLINMVTNKKGDSNDTKI